MAIRAVEVRSLRRTFKGGVEAVRDIDLTIAAGEVFGFLGPNGAGQDDHRADALHAAAADRRAARASPASTSSPTGRRSGGGSASRSRRSGSTPCRPGASCSSSSAGCTGSRARTPTARAEELLELVGLTDAADRRTKTYSGGMKRRLDLASALVHSPEVLFLDEPTTGLDPASRLTVWDEVRRINATGTTVFLTTQYLEEADQLCDRLAIIDDGRIVAEGTPERLKAQMGHDVVRVALDGADAGATEAALGGLPGLERVVTEADALALYVEDGAGSIAEIVRRLDRAEHPGRGDRRLAALARRRVPAGDRAPARGRRGGARRGGGGRMTETLLLGRRAVREIARYPEATIPALFIPLFFLAVNIGQVSETFPDTTPFLKGQGYVAFQLPVSLMFAVATATSGLALVTEIDNGYFDKLLVAPIRRSSIIFGRLAADLVRGLLGSTVVLIAGLAFGAHMESGVLGAIVLVVLAALFGVGYAGFGILVALRTRNVQATNTSFLLFFPLLFLTPNFVPFDRLTPVMEALARINPVSYVIVGLRSLVIDGWVLGQARGLPGRDRRADRRAHGAVAARDRDVRPRLEARPSLSGARGWGSRSGSRRPTRSAGCRGPGCRRRP